VAYLTTDNIFLVKIFERWCKHSSLPHCLQWST